MSIYYAHYGFLTHAKYLALRGLQQRNCVEFDIELNPLANVVERSCGIYHKKQEVVLDVRLFFCLILITYAYMYILNC